MRRDAQRSRGWGESLRAAVGAGVVGVGVAMGGEIRGVDASFVPQIEAVGGVLRDRDGAAIDPVAFYAAQGVNTVRLRVWNNPADGDCNVARTLALAQRVHAAGMDLLIDFHYSDGWADPGQQTKPTAWSGLSTAGLAAAVETFTRETVAALAAQGTPAKYVQIGNEITDGMLWENGRVSAWSDGNWSNLAALVNAGVRGARQGGGTEGPRVILHIDRGGDWTSTREFFDRAAGFGIDYDIIGLSYYPWWHGGLDALRTTVENAAARFARPVVVVETAYPWTLAWADQQHNFVGNAGQLLPGYPATPTGQGEYIGAVRALMRSVTDGWGAGFVYWAPDYGAFAGLASPWENLAMFDFSGRAHASWDAFLAWCPADLNNDRLIDDADFVIFAGAYDVFDCADPGMAGECRADLNQDGVVDDMDFVMFAGAYDGFRCDGQ